MLFYFVKCLLPPNNCPFFREGLVYNNQSFACNTCCALRCWTYRVPTWAFLLYWQNNWELPWFLAWSLWLCPSPCLSHNIFKLGLSWWKKGSSPRLDFFHLLFSWELRSVTLEESTGGVTGNNTYSFTLK